MLLRRVEVVGPLHGQRLVEQRLQQLLEEVVVAPPAAPGLARRHAQPALLLQEVEEDDLAQQLLGEGAAVDAPGFELGANPAVAGRNGVQLVPHLHEELLVAAEELPSDGLDVEGVLQVGQRGVVAVVGQDGEKLLLSGVVGLVLAHQEGVAPRPGSGPLPP